MHGKWPKFYKSKSGMDKKNHANHNINMVSLGPVTNLANGQFTTSHNSTSHQNWARPLNTLYMRGFRSQSVI